MPESPAPGVYIEEIGRGPRPIEGVSTSTAAFTGETERGPLRPRLVTGYTEYQRWFGETLADDRFVPHAVRGFFQNGGQRLYVARIFGDGASTASSHFGDFVVTAIGPGAWGRRVWVRGTRGVVFEPNDEHLWAKVTDTIRGFLRNQWRGGALPGRTEDEAFFVKCDRTTMTQTDIGQGRLICEFGVAAVCPAEFMIFRICQRAAEAQG